MIKFIENVLKYNGRLTATSLTSIANKKGFKITRKDLERFADKGLIIKDGKFYKEVSKWVTYYNLNQ